MGNYKKIKIFNKEYKFNNDIYVFVIWEQIFCGGNRLQRRANLKTYEIIKNNECILYTSLHQTFYARKRKIEKGLEKEWFIWEIIYFIMQKNLI